MLVVHAHGELGRSLLHLLTGEKSFVEEERFQRCQPCLVVRSFDIRRHRKDMLVVFVTTVSGDLLGKSVAELLPSIGAALAERQRHAERSPFPGSLED